MVNASDRTVRRHLCSWLGRRLSFAARSVRVSIKPVTFAAVLLLIAAPVFAQADGPAAALLPKGIGGPSDWTSPQGLASTLQVMLLLTVVSLAPAILLMTTGFVRIIVVLGLLRQASARSNCRQARSLLPSHYS